jgi:iron complex transport system substrate-binding protein
MLCCRIAKRRFDKARNRLALIAGLLLLPLAAHAREVTDVTNAKVRLADHPERIVTLAPSLGELAADLSGSHLEKIVGVSEYTDYPPVLSKVASIGSYARFNLERVVALKPDLVLATLDGNPKDQVLHLRELGIPVVVVATSTLDDVSRSMRLVAQAMGVSEQGEQMAARFAAGLRNIRDRAAHREGPKPRVVLQLGDDPLVVAGHGSFLQEALETVGAQNLYGDGATHYPRPALEDVVHRSPDVIIVLALGHDLTSFDAMAARWAQFSSLKAVKSRQVRVLQGDAILRPTLRLLEGLSLLEKAVYGKR